MRHCLSLVLSLTCLIRTEATEFEALPGDSCFETNPFTDAFRRVDEAVARKQAYETRQIKELFHGPEGRTDIETTAQLTERVRQPLVAAIRREFRPVSHTLHLKPE